MELWIRSQDKRILIKVYNVFLNANYDNKRISTYDGDSNTTLGEYKTKERALEVLDEIQEAELGNFHYKCPSNIKVSNNEDTIVYQMPTE
jgi:hypothetical protein